MHEPHPAEPLSLVRLRAFLAARAALPPRARNPATVAGQFTPSLTPARRPAKIGASLIGHRSPVSPAPDSSPPQKLPATPGASIGNGTPPAARFFRSLLGGASAHVPAGEKEKSSPAPPAESAMMRRVKRESPPRVLPAGLQAFLAARLGLRLPPVQIHVGPAADRMTTHYRADAVSFGNRIAVRHDRYEPQTVRGAALLGHELTHVAAAAQPPRTVAGAVREERTALANEHRLLVENVQAPRHIQPPAAPVAAPVLSPVRAATVDRPRPSEPGVANRNTSQEAQLKEELVRDLLDRLRTDFERGS